MNLTPELSEQAIPLPMQAVLELFESELGDLKFPDLDLSVLREAASSVYQRAEAQAVAEAALLTAREALQESQEALLQKCQRAIAYARVYAEDDVELLGKLEAISLPRGGRSKAAAAPNANGEARPASKRGRRSPAPSGPLFMEPLPPEESPALERQAA